MNNRYSHACKMFSCFLGIAVLIGLYVPCEAVANEQSFLEGQIENYINEHQEDMVGLATIVIDKDEVIYKMAGYADIENQISVDEDTVFEWASVSKILIWISVLQLVEQGKLDLETDIKTYLPQDFRSKTNFDEPITMYDLMHHSAGFDDSYTDLMIHRPSSIKGLREVLEEADINQIFVPGEVVAYSNYGSGLAAFIVEEVSGLDYQEYVRKHIFEPLQMTKTTIDPEQADQKWVKEQREKAQGYSQGRQLVEPNLYTLPMYPIGSVMGTATDLQKLLQAFLAEDETPLFKNNATLDVMFEPTLYYPNTDIPRIAHGLFYLPSKNQHVYGHNGNSKAFSSSFYVDREEQRGVLVLTNIKDEMTFTMGIPELTFGEYEHRKDQVRLEDSSQWNGIYEPARIPSSGFSKIYGLFLRGKTEQSGSDELIMNGFYYSQLHPGIYKTEDGPSLYSLDVYSEHPQLKTVLSNTYSDLIYVHTYKHYLEWGGMILAVIAAFFSLVYVFTVSLRRLWNKKPRHFYLFGQHIVNLLMVLNVLWLVYKTISMVSYASLKPFLTLNLAYIVIAFVYSGFLVVKLNSQPLTKREKRVWIMTIACTIILCGNLLYWEFYF